MEVKEIRKVRQDIEKRRQEREVKRSREEVAAIKREIDEAIKKVMYTDNKPFTKEDMLVCIKAIKQEVDWKFIEMLRFMGCDQEEAREMLNTWDTRWSRLGDGN